MYFSLNFRWPMVMGRECEGGSPAPSSAFKALPRPPGPADRPGPPPARLPPIAALRPTPGGPDLLAGLRDPRPHHPGGVLPHPGALGGGEKRGPLSHLGLGLGGLGVGGHGGAQHGGFPSHHHPHHHHHHPHHPIVPTSTHPPHPAFSMSMPPMMAPNAGVDHLAAAAAAAAGPGALALSHYLQDPLAKAALLDLGRLGHYPLGKKLFGCPQCRYMTDRKNNLKRHVSTMHQECDKVLECCGVAFKNKASLRDHVVIFHSNGYMCRYCGRNFCRKALLKRHLTVHSGQKDYLCGVCDYATSHKSNLERHKKVHERQGDEDGDSSDPEMLEEPHRRAFCCGEPGGGYTMTSRCANISHDCDVTSSSCNSLPSPGAMSSKSPSGTSHCLAKILAPRDRHVVEKAKADSSGSVSGSNKISFSSLGARRFDGDLDSDSDIDDDMSDVSDIDVDYIDVDDALRENTCDAIDVVRVDS